MTLNEVQPYLQAGSNIATTLGIIFATASLTVTLRTYRNERRKERIAKEYATFDDLDDKYVEFMYACTQHPHLDLFPDAADPNRKVSQEDLNTEKALYAVLISIFERAFILFKIQADKNIRKLQYLGWIECMRTYCTRRSFLSQWNTIGRQFDNDFQVKMNSIIQEEQKKLNTLIPSSD
jgi:hypothetical protein